MKTRRVMALLTAAVMSAAMLAGCGSSSDTASGTASTTAAADAASTTADTAASTADAADTTADAAVTTADTTADAAASVNTDLTGTVSTNGSTSMEDVIQSLIEAFNEEYPNVTVNYNPTGSGSGITAATEGSCDIGLASRDLKDDENADGSLTQTTIALDGIAIIVNNANPVTDLTIDQIASIYTDGTNNWKDVGGDDGDIAVIGREAGSGTRDGFETITGTKDACVLDQELTSTGNVISAVQNNPQAIGYASLAAVAENTDAVKAVSVEGVAPSEDTIADGTYKIQRDFNLITNNTKPLSDAAQAFFDFCTDPANADIISNAGAVPVNK